MADICESRGSWRPRFGLETLVLVDHRLRNLDETAATANYAGKWLEETRYKLIVQTCVKILAGYHDIFPLHVWMTGSGTHGAVVERFVRQPCTSVNRQCEAAPRPLLSPRRTIWRGSKGPRRNVWPFWFSES